MGGRSDTFLNQNRNRTTHRTIVNQLYCHPPEGKPGTWSEGKSQLVGQGLDPGILMTTDLFRHSPEGVSSHLEPGFDFRI